MNIPLKVGGAGSVIIVMAIAMFWIGGISGAEAATNQSIDVEKLHQNISAVADEARQDMKNNSTYNAYRASAPPIEFFTAFAHAGLDFGYNHPGYVDWMRETYPIFPLGWVTGYAYWLAKRNAWKFRIRR